MRQLTGDGGGVGFQRANRSISPEKYNSASEADEVHQQLKARRKRHHHNRMQHETLFPKDSYQWEGS